MSLCWKVSNQEALLFIFSKFLEANIPFFTIFLPRNFFPTLFLKMVFEHFETLVSLGSWSLIFFAFVFSFMIDDILVLILFIVLTGFFDYWSNCSLQLIFMILCAHQTTVYVNKEIFYLWFLEGCSNFLFKVLQLLDLRALNRLDMIGESFPFCADLSNLFVPKFINFTQQ